MAGGPTACFVTLRVGFFLVGLYSMIAIFLAILSGLLLSAGFPKPAMFYLSWAALVPLLYAVENRNGKQALALGFVCGLVHSVTCLFWGPITPFIISAVFRWLFPYWFFCFFAP